MGEYYLDNSASTYIMNQLRDYTTVSNILSEDDVKKLISNSKELRRMKSMKWKLAGRRHRR